MGDPPKPTGLAVDSGPIVERTGARGHGLFGGRLDKSRLGFAERVVVGVARGTEGDFRDWKEIADWAGEIAGELRPNGR